MRQRARRRLRSAATRRTTPRTSSAASGALKSVQARSGSASARAASGAASPSAAASCRAVGLLQAVRERVAEVGEGGDDRHMPADLAEHRDLGRIQARRQVQQQRSQGVGPAGPAPGRLGGQVRQRRHVVVGAAEVPEAAKGGDRCRGDRPLFGDGVEGRVRVVLVP